MAGQFSEGWVGCVLVHADDPPIAFPELERTATVVEIVSPGWRWGPPALVKVIEKAEPLGGRGEEVSVSQEFR